MSTVKINDLVEEMANERAKEILTEVACDLQGLSEEILSKAHALEGKMSKKADTNSEGGRANRGKWALMLLNWRKQDELTQKQAAKLIQDHTGVQIRQFNLSVFEHGRRKELDPEIREAIQEYLEGMDI